MRTLHYIAVAVAAVLFAACSSKKAEPQLTPISVTTEVATASSDYLDKTYVGTIEANTSTPVSFTGIGTVTRVCVEEGQHVSKGQLIAELDDTQARNMLATAQAQMEQANDGLARMKQLHEAGSLPDVKWIEIQTQVSQAKSQLEMCKKNLADCKIYAPVSGVVGSKVFENGMTAVTSEPVVTILDITKVKVRVAVPEREMGAITANTRSTVSVEAIGSSFEGGHIDKGVTADAVTHTYDIKITLPNPNGRLLPGMIANVSLHGNATDAPAAITVPIRSVQQSGAQQFVWVAKDGKAHRQNVTLGETYGNRIVILSGLEGGETVITEGYQKVGEGSAVAL